MTFKENLKAKIRLDRLLHKLVSTIREPPDKRWLDKVLTRELFDMTDFEHRKAGSSLQLYVRPLKDDVMEVAVFDNELPIYHTTVADVVLRKNPCWQEMFSIRNIRKIMNDNDILISRGKESLKRLDSNAMARLDLAYTPDDLRLLLEDARKGLDNKSMERIQESLDLFSALLHFKPMPLGIPMPGLRVLARPKPGKGDVPAFEHLTIFKEETLLLGLKKGDFSPQDDSDLAWALGYARGQKTADLQGISVFEFLAELALGKKLSATGRYDPMVKG